MSPHTALIDELVNLAEHATVGVDTVIENLDELVHDLHGAWAARTANHTHRDLDDIANEAEAAASAINKGGLRDQISYVISTLGAAGRRDVLSAIADGKTCDVCPEPYWATFTDGDRSLDLCETDFDRVR